MTTPLPPLPEWMRLAEPFASAAKEYAQQAAKAERKAALLWAAELCEKMDGSSCGLGFRTQYDCAVRLRAEAEKIK